MRWIALALFLVMVIFAYRSNRVKSLALAMVVGSVMGFAIDLYGVWFLGMWYYPRQPFLSVEYFGIVLPCWGVFGSLINQGWDYALRYKKVVVALFGLGVALFYELPNLITGSWVYIAPFWLIIPGWGLLVLNTRWCYLATKILLTEAIKGGSYDYKLEG